MDDTGALSSRADAARTLRWELAADPRAATLARVAVRSALNEQEVPVGVVDNVVLGTSELVTNALRHAGDQLVVEMTIEPDVVEIAVTDGAPHLPIPRDPTEDEETGRGLLIVSAISSAWGVEDAPTGGKRVWVRFRNQAAY